ncbi:unnamed protein product [Lactuca virosa]|uniref:Uncharacterized protein n=1 Tax=Lactuca virosa TaxID=75947 RepID=A0AAU9MB69_9ASTR|nr:unnamed protein product [Lactuca virosa]
MSEYHRNEESFVKEHREEEAELRVSENMDEVHEPVEKPSEKIHDGVDEPRDEEVELQVPQDMPCVDEYIAILNGNDDDKEYIPRTLIKLYGLSNDLANLFHDLSTVNLVNGCDQWKSRPDSDGYYTVGALRRLTDQQSIPSQSQPPTTWLKEAPIKVNCFYMESITKENTFFVGSEFAWY